MQDWFNNLENSYLTIEDAIEGLDPYRSEVVRGLWYIDNPAARRYAACGRENTSRIQYCPRCEENDPYFPARVVPISCMDRSCNLCAQRVAAPIRHHYESIIQHLWHNKKRGYSLRFLTFTTDTLLEGNKGEEFKDMLDDVVCVLRNVMLKDKQSGAIVTGEVGESGNRMHAHVIAYCRWIPQERLSKAWEEQTGYKIVGIRAFDNLESVLSEGLKYATKFVNLRPDQLVDLHMSLKGHRRVRSFGVLYNSKYNPYREFFECDDYTGCECPVCNQIMVMVGQSYFEAEIGKRRMWTMTLGAIEIVKLNRIGLANLNLIEANKFYGHDPP